MSYKNCTHNFKQKNSILYYITVGKWSRVEITMFNKTQIINRNKIQSTIGHGILTSEIGTTQPKKQPPGREQHTLDFFHPLFPFFPHPPLIPSWPISKYMQFYFPWLYFPGSKSCHNCSRNYLRWDHVKLMEFKFHRIKYLFISLLHSTGTIHWTSQKS